MKLEGNEYRIILGAVIFIVGLLIMYLTDIEELYVMIFFGIGFVIMGYEVAIDAVKNLIDNEFLDENFLMVIAAVGAFAIGEYPEGFAVLLFFNIGEAFEDRAVEKTRRSVSDLMNIQPEFANVLRNGELQTVDPSDVKVGEIVVVKPGEKIPLDGRIIEGDTSIDTVALTGESAPKHLREGDDILNGCVNLTSVIKVDVSKLYEDSTVVRILGLIEDSASKKSKTEKFITKFARYYTPAVVVAALLVAVIPSLLFPEQASTWIYRALMALVVSCPCALVISIPLTLFCGIGCASENGILVKGSNYLEALASAETVVFDKTGTLTKGDFSVTIVEPVNISEKELIEIAAKAEFYSDHPVSISIKNRHGKEIDVSEIGTSENISGKGVRTEVLGKIVHVGNAKLMEDQGIISVNSDIPGTHVHIAVDGEYAGHIVVSDVLKDDSGKAVTGLREEGVSKIVMLTGDTEMVGAAIATELELDEVHAELLPQDKIERLEALLNRDGREGSVIFVGDGINDAPSLARADVGIAMGAFGSDAAIEAADVVIMDDSPSKVTSIIRIAKHTMGIAKQNIVFSLALKIGILFLIVLGSVGMWAAIFADVGVLILAILNSTRALKTKGLSRKKLLN